MAGMPGPPGMAGIHEVAIVAVWGNGRDIPLVCEV